MENNANQQLNPMMCKSNCGFYGNAAYDGYCSKCYKEHVKRQNSGSAAGRVTPTSSSNSTGASVSISAVVQQQQQQQLDIPSSNEVVMATATIGEQAQSSITLSETATPIMSSHQQTAPIAIPVQTTVITTSNDVSSVSSSSNTPVITNTIAPAQAAAADPMSMSCDASTLMSTQQQTPSSSLLSTSAVSTTSCSSAAPGTSVDSTGSDKKKRSRCSLESCKRKVGLTGFDCRCGGLFCWEHRYSDKHNCQFDYKELGQDQIRKNNPIVVGEKIQKI